VHSTECNDSFQYCTSSPVISMGGTGKICTLVHYIKTKQNQLVLTVDYFEKIWDCVPDGGIHLQPPNLVLAEPAELSYSYKLVKSCLSLCSGYNLCQTCKPILHTRIY